MNPLDSKFLFTEAEALLLHCMLAGNCSFNKFQEGGDYARNWMKTCEIPYHDQDAFCAKLDRLPNFKEPK